MQTNYTMKLSSRCRLLIVNSLGLVISLAVKQRVFKTRVNHISLASYTNLLAHVLSK